MISMGRHSTSASSYGMGGGTGASRELIRSEAEVSRAQTDVSLHSLRRRVNEIYFALLLLSEQARYNDLFHEEILRTKHKVETLIQGGVATPTDLDAVEADRLRSERTQSEYLALRRSYLGALGLLMGDTLPDSTRLSFPEAEARVAGDKARPELEVLALQTQTLGARRRELSASLLPTLGLFAQGGLCSSRTQRPRARLLPLLHHRGTSLLVSRGASIHTVIASAYSPHRSVASGYSVRPSSPTSR